MASSMAFDFNQMIQKFKIWLNRTIALVQAYFKSLTQYELYAWIGEGVGFVMILISLITW
jgi:hypothetical protein